MTNPLLDDEFLKKLTTAHEREIFARVIALDFDENPIEEITGNVTQGSINVDGTSAIRRSCSLTMVAQELNINDYYWGLNTKVQISIGMKNIIDSRYPDIIWFQQGIFVITTFNTSQSQTGWQISLQGKDKMCLLNGDVGGSITALSVDFGKLKIEEKDSAGNIFERKEDYLLKNIIKEAVHEYAKEPYHNIIINDLDDVGLELLEYRSLTPLYMLFNQEVEEVTNYSFGGSSQKYFLYDSSSDTYVANVVLDDIAIYDNRITLDFGAQSNNPTIIYAFEENRYVPYSVIKVIYGDVVGYRITDLTYAGDLIASVGSSITSAVLDKIVNQLGEFEYFYDLEGRFIFQKKKTYVKTLFNNLVYSGENDIYGENAMYTSSYIYSFEDSNLVTAFQNTPNLSNVKNDFSVWGKRKSKSTGTEIPIHLRYAIDTKPVTYTTYEGRTYTTLPFNIEEDIAAIKKENDEKLEELSKYRKTKNPNGLDEDWWEIMDWANYYRILTGEYPQDSIGKYANEGNGGNGVDRTQLDKYFSIAKHGQYSYYDPGQSFKVYIFDVDYDVDYSGSRTIGYTGHGTGCGHPYSYFLDRALQGNGTSYIYKPMIPDAVYAESLNKKISELLTPMLNRTAIYNCDWRELIYQMARDHSLYGHNDDFESKLISHNKKLYPTGITGYEQYYTDMYSFWRDLYNPNPKEVRKYHYTKLTDQEAKAYWVTLQEQGRLYMLDAEAQNYVQVVADQVYENKYIYYRREETNEDEDIVGQVFSYNNQKKPSFSEVADDDLYEVLPVPQNVEILDGNGESYVTATDKTILYAKKSTNYLTLFDPNVQYYLGFEDGTYQEVEKVDGMYYFNIGNNYYTYHGYQAVTNFKPGHTYYSRTGNSTMGYVYEVAFNINADEEYHLDTGEKITSFTSGNTYYGNNGDVVDIGLRTYYELLGAEGFVKVYEGNTLQPGYYYYTTDEGKIIYLPENTAAVGVFNYYYSPYTINDDTTETMAYIRDAQGNFEMHKILHNFNIAGHYYYLQDGKKWSTYQHRQYKNPSQTLYHDNTHNPDNYWTVDIDSPELLHFWFDFLDTEGELSQYSVPKIGARPKAENNSDVTAIYYRETPTVIFVDPDDDLSLQKQQKPGYTFVRCPDYVEELFTISAKRKSAKQQLDTNLYNYTYCTESISLTVLPVYYLQPNTRIFVHDEKSGINGEYIVTKFTVPLAYNGTMQITATKAVENMY